MKKYKIEFFPDNKVIEVEEGENILSSAISAGIYINSNCGGEGICGKCKVLVRKGKIFSKSTAKLSEREKEKGIVLACLAIVQSDLEVEILPESRLSLEKIRLYNQEDSRHRFLYPITEEIVKPLANLEENIFRFSPLVEKIYLELPPPNFKDIISDLDRVYRAIYSIYNDSSIIDTELGIIRKLSKIIRQAGYRVTLAIASYNKTKKIISIERGDKSERNFGFCFDIGTTTICAELIDLKRKELLSAKSIYNRQAIYGSDVISRIIFANTEEGLEKLHRMVIETMNDLIKEMTIENKIDSEEITCILCAGNATMMHLFMKIDPTYIRREPYIPVFNILPPIEASNLNLQINPYGLVFCVPGVSSYVGADIVSGILFSGIYKEQDLCLLIDIGTNGEIVLGNKDFLISCAASAGPAFEGSGLSSGMPAAKGAIQQIEIEPQSFKIKYSIIGNTKPLGICGSGYIDIISELLNYGLLDRNGKFTNKMTKYLRENNFEKEFVLVPKEEASTFSDIVITEADIENIKRAKAAIYAAMATLLKHIGLSFSDVKRIFIAGGFGTYINIDKAINIGLLPDLDKSHFYFIGNSCLGGLRLGITSREAFNKFEEIAKKVTYIDLSNEPNYMEEYTSALFFPHTELKRFPNVKY